jgi:hypothetical protein
MPPYTNEKKRHHYVPIAYLNGYTDSEDKVLAYRKDLPQTPLHLKPSEIAFERYYYSQPLPDGGRDNNSLEDLFSTIEASWTPIVERIRAQKDVRAEEEAIIVFMSTMRVRVPAARDMVEASLSENVKATTRYLDHLTTSQAARCRRYSRSFSGFHRPPSINPRHAVSFAGFRQGRRSIRIRNSA